MTGGFEALLHTKIYPPTSIPDTDHVIRRAFALYRLCFDETADALEQINERLKECIDPHWAENYAVRTGEEPRMHLPFKPGKT